MDIRDLLENVKNNNLDIEDALDILKDLPYEDLGYANIDHHRQIRNGYPEVIYCEGKTDEHILGIIDKMNKKKSNILGRLSVEKRNNILMAIVLPLGTLVSGILFLGTAKIIVGLPASFSILFLTVVVPSVALNTVIGLVLYRIVEKSLRRASYSIRG